MDELFWYGAEMGSRPKRPFTIYMSLKGKIAWDVYFQLRSMNIRVFWTDTKTALEYAEITPINKGNLWKIRCFCNGHYDVYYGTIKKAYCTTIQDTLKFIQQQSKLK